MLSPPVTQFPSIHVSAPIFLPTPFERAKPATCRRSTLASMKYSDWAVVSSGTILPIELSVRAEWAEMRLIWLPSLKKSEPRSAGLVTASPFALVCYRFLKPWTAPRDAYIGVVAMRWTSGSGWPIIRV